MGYEYRREVPIYLQLIDILKAKIIDGSYHAGDRLPPIRDLALEYEVTPNTIQRAYRELEAEGFICSIAGKGSYVSALSEVDESRRAEKLVQFREAAQELLRLGTAKTVLTALLDELEQEVST